MDNIKVLDLTEHKGRVFFTTDIHGCFDLLHEHLKNASFSGDTDILIVGGDMCDRGPDSQYVLDYLQEPWLYCIRANHEQLFIESYREGWKGPATNCLISNGGGWVMDRTEAQLKDIYEAFNSLPLALELLLPNERVGVVHAEVPQSDWEYLRTAPLADIEADAQWARTRYSYGFKQEVIGIDRVLVGHTPTDSGEVEILGNVWYADLGSFFRDKICFLQLM